MDNRREHAGGTPRADRCQDQWVPLCDFPFEVLDGFAHDEEPPLYPAEKFADALREIAMWISPEDTIANLKTTGDSED